MPLVAARLAWMRAVEHRDPAQRHAHGHGRAQQDVRLHFEALQVDVRLVEPVEQHQAVGAGVVEALGHVGEVAEERAELHRHRNGHLGLHRLEDVEVGLLDLGGGQVHVRGDVIDVQLERVGAGLLDRFGVLRPAADGRAVQAGDDGDFHRLLGLGDVLEVFLRAEAEFLRFGEIGERFGEAVGAVLQVLCEFERGPGASCSSNSE